MKDFTGIEPERILFQNEHFFIIKDLFPVSPGHLLIISNQVRKDYFDLTSDEQQNLNVTIRKAKEYVEKEHSPDGYNIGMNCGPTAGQTVFHFHCHLIPRYKNDVENPRGEIRNVIPGKGDY